MRGRVKGEGADVRCPPPLGCGLYRNILKEAVEGYFGKGSYQGPDECISDSTESKYLNNDEVCSVPGWGGVLSDVFLDWGCPQ